MCVLVDFRPIIVVLVYREYILLCFAVQHGARAIDEKTWRHFGTFQEGAGADFGRLAHRI